MASSSNDHGIIDNNGLIWAPFNHARSLGAPEGVYPDRIP